MNSFRSFSRTFFCMKPRSGTEAFRSAPQELSRWISLRQAVGLVRLAIEIFEEQLPEFAATDAEQAALIEGILRYGREIAFATANSYAAAAEARGAWDARLEALVVDGIVRGDAEESVVDGLRLRDGTKGAPELEEDRPLVRP